MSEAVPLSSIEVENENLKKQLEQNSIGVENLLATLDANRSFVNDLTQSLINLKTSNNLLVKKIQILEAQVTHGKGSDKHSAISQESSCT